MTMTFEIDSLEAKWMEWKLWTCPPHSVREWTSGPVYSILSVQPPPTYPPTHVDYKGSHFNLVECKSLCPVQPIDMQPRRMRRLLLGYPPHALA